MIGKLTNYSRFWQFYQFSVDRIEIVEEVEDELHLWLWNVNTYHSTSSQVKWQWHTRKIKIYTRNWINCLFSFSIYWQHDATESSFSHFAVFHSFDSFSVFHWRPSGHARGLPQVRHQEGRLIQPRGIDQSETSIEVTWSPLTNPSTSLWATGMALSMAGLTTLMGGLHTKNYFYLRDST